jgi:mannose-6-phosphate isomerase-like protein (cupin superfamily)/GNAT superfamily N-acetyltransferase
MVAIGHSRVRVRAIRVTDDVELQRFYSGLSARSRRSRFLCIGTGLSSSQVASFCRTDHDHREGFVAVANEGSDAERVVGHLCLEPDGAEAAELAIAVADEFQHLGIGRRLMAAGREWARCKGIARLTATMFVDNAAMHGLLAHQGLPTRITYLGAGVAEITIDLRAQRVAARRAALRVLVAYRQWRLGSFSPGQGPTPLADFGLKEVAVSFNQDIVARARANGWFREVLATGPHCQVVVMSIPPGGEIGEEVHDSVDQVLVCVEGEGLAVLEGERSPVHPGHLVHVPSGTRHNLVNAGAGDLKLYTVYAPPEHADGTIHRTKGEADASEEHYQPGNG